MAATENLTTEAIQAAQLVNYFSSAGMTIMIADYLHTFPREVQLVWPTKPSMPKLLFLLVRYGNFLLALLVYLFSLTSHPIISSNGCKNMFIIIGMLEGILSTLGEAIIYIRVWAFCGCDRKALYPLATLYAVLNTVSFSFLGKYVTSTQVILAPQPTHLTCMCVGDSPLLVSLSFGVMLASVVCMMSVMVAVGVRRYRSTGVIILPKGGLLKQFYKDGATYFLMLVILNCLNIAIHIFEKDGVQYTLVKTQIYLHGMIATRLVLHLRAYAENERYNSSEWRSGANSSMAGFEMRDETRGSQLRFACGRIRSTTSLVMS